MYPKLRSRSIVSADRCGADPWADPLVRSRRPRPLATEIDKAPKSGSGGTRADQGVRPTSSYQINPSNGETKPRARTNPEVIIGINRGTQGQQLYSRGLR
jgi:hypothetical protein